MDITSHPGSARKAAIKRDIDINVNAPVAAAPPYPIIKTARKGPNANMAPATL